MRLVKIAKTPTKNMLQVDIPEGSGIWAWCSPQVKAYAEKNLQLGDEIDLTYTCTDGKYEISFIKKAGQGSSPQQGNQPPQQTGFKCEDCGVALKDGKYKKCYTCNQKAPKQTKSRDTKESIEMQNCNNATSRALIALQGQVDLNNIVSVINTLWDTFYAKLKK